MRRGWMEWLLGTLLVLAAASFGPAFAIAVASAVPPVRWTFYVLYGTIAVVIGIAAMRLLIRGWALRHLPEMPATTA